MPRRPTPNSTTSTSTQAEGDGGGAQVGPEEVQEVADTPVEYQGRRLVWTVTLPMAQHSKCGSRQKEPFLFIASCWASYACSKNSVKMTEWKWSTPGWQVKLRDHAGSNIQEQTRVPWLPCQGLAHEACRDDTGKPVAAGSMKQLGQSLQQLEKTGLGSAAKNCF